MAIIQGNTFLQLDTCYWVGKHVSCILIGFHQNSERTWKTGHSWYWVSANTYIYFTGFIVLFTIEFPVITMRTVQLKEKKKDKLLLSSTPTSTCGQVNICKQAGLLLGWMTMPSAPSCPQGKHSLCCLRVRHFFQTPAPDSGAASIPRLLNLEILLGAALTCSPCLAHSHCGVAVSISREWWYLWAEKRQLCLGSAWSGKVQA